MRRQQSAQWPHLHDRYPHGRLGRYREVVQILARHGFGWLLAQIGVAQPPPFPWGLFGRRPPTPTTQAEHLRLALEELGVTWIKLGQILSTRSDLLPPDYIAELSRLQDAVPAEPMGVIEAQIVRELGRSTPDLFARFDPEPVGSASIGQVHAAWLKSGEEVVVKVQRPGVEALVEEDLAILRDLARLAAGRTVWGRTYDFPALVDEFATTLRGELDYVLEGQNADRFRRDFRGDPRLRVPAIYWDYTTRRVLTMERLEGIKISDLSALEQAGIDRKVLARRAARMVLKMILEEGFFHADPHPGNFVVMEGEVIGLLDYGMVGRLDEATRDGLLYLLLAVSNQDLDKVVDQLVVLGVTGTGVQLDHLRHDLGHLLSLYWGLPLREISISHILEEAMNVVRRHRLRMPTSLVLLTKTMAMNEGLARTLDPEFSAAEVLRPYVLQLALERYLPQNWGKRLLPTLLDLGQMAVTLPRRTERLLTRMERGNLSINMHVQDTEHVLDVLNGMVNRLILGMVASGFAVAIALLLQSYYTVGLRGLLGWLLGIGMAIVAALGFWLAAGILHRGHH
ncbi:MAG: ABC1 kinase family protein [Chloroflexota bacterium]